MHPPPPSAPASASAAAPAATRPADPAEKTWRVGTLTYDRRGLFNVFFWMLWGDFVLNVMDNGVGSNVALIQLRKFGASKLTIGMLTGSIPEFITIFMVAIVSTWSDHHRGPLGRRRSRPAVCDRGERHTRARSERAVGRRGRG